MKELEREMERKENGKVRKGEGREGKEMEIKGKDRKENGKQRKGKENGMDWK